MIFADADFYKNEYLLGRTEIIPLEEFSFWARDASNKINWKNVKLADEQIIEPLRICTCAVAEELFLNKEKEFMSMEPSQSVGAYSKGAVNIKQEQADFNVRVDGIIKRNLAGGELHNLFVFKGG